MDGYTATSSLRDMGVKAPVVITTANQVAGNREAEESVRVCGAQEV